MEEDRLFPNISTHFQCMLECSMFGGARITKGKIYKIEEWGKEPTGINYYRFRDDAGTLTKWYGTSGIRDCSYESNLKEILE